MTTLAERQAAFLAAILDEREPLPEGWGNSQTNGMQVYRGNYRSALMGVLEDTYERTWRYVGEAPFRRLAMHHVIRHPPSGWTIDEAGAGFAETCAELVTNNPEVAELAWLEWTMRSLATAPDSAPLNAQDFDAASAGFDDEDWANLRLEFGPRAQARLVGHDLDAMWRALAEEGAAMPEAKLETPATCLVWREGEKPTFILAPADHAEAFTAMQQGAAYGEVIGVLLGEAEPTPQAIQQAAMRAGEMLGTWLGEGLVTRLT